MIEFHDPRGEVKRESFPYELSLQVTGSNQTKIGLLANGFPDSEAFLDQIACVLRETEPGVEIERYNKGNASIPAPAEMLEDIRKDCHAVIAAYGH
jgi:hypothetical protein